MIYQEYSYVELVMDKLTNRNTVVGLSEVSGLVANSSGRDCYRSYYRHPVEFSQYVRKNHTVSGWSGPCYSDYLWLDIDRPDLNDALETARYMANRLEQLYEVSRNTLRIYFSGAKGFHIGINTRYFGLGPSEKFPAQFKAIARSLADDIEIDLAIYDKLRIFRLNNTINTKSGLYKVPLDYTQLEGWSIEVIRDWASEARDDAGVEYAIDEGALSYLVEEVEESAPSMPVGDIPRIRKKSLHGTKICLWRMMQGVGEGMRDESALRLASDFQKKGMPVSVTVSLMKAWNEHNVPPLTTEVVLEKVASAYGRKQYDFGCNDHILQSFCHEDCHLFKMKDVAEEPIKVYTMEELEPIYKEYVKNSAKTKIQFPCMPRINGVMRGLRPKEVAIIMARPGVGKSLVAQTILQDVAMKQKIPSVFFSIEMPAEQVFERAASMETKWSPTDIEDMYWKDDHERITETMPLFRDVYIVDKGNLSLGDIQKTVEGIGEVGLVVIDYMSLVRSPGNTIYERMSYVARQLKPLAKETGAAVLMISQVSRLGGDGTEPITLAMGRDTGAIEEGGDFIMGMWCDDMDKEIRVIQLLKGRRGGAGMKDKMGLLGMSVKFVSATGEDDDASDTDKI